MQKYKIITYGCQMNIHESEKIAGILEYLGYTATEDEKESDIIVFNTCCIRDNAEKRALGNIGALKSLKRKNKNLILAVVGCMTQQDGSGVKLRASYPYVDIVLGTNNLHLLEDCINEIKNKRSPKVIIDTNENPPVRDRKSVV